MTTAASTESYAGILSQRMTAERLSLAAQWLTGLNRLLMLDANEVFPSDQLLDHIPALIGEIATYLRAPTDEEITANAAVIDKARELGVLRHNQHASVHQVLREYEMLAEILERFVVVETERLGLQPLSSDCFELQRRLTHATRALMRTTVETFISEYTTTIEERNERLRTFNRMASHELRSPIGTLLFAAAVLDTESVRSDPQRLARVVATVRTNAERLSWLVQNLQRLARVGDRPDSPSEQRVEVETVAREVARQLEDMATAHGVAIRIDSHLPALFIDPARLELVLLNLVSNAIKYSDPMKPESFVDVTAWHEGDGTCVVRVRDNGLGIPNADKDAVFDRFFRAHAHLDAQLGVTGTGLGLPIVLECVQAMGGAIRCESVVGEGTTFLITLPCEERQAGP